MFAKVLIGSLPALCVPLLLMPQVLVTRAEAASVDCNGPHTPFARAVCNTPELSKADDALAAAFKAALDGLSAPAKAEVRSAQDSWVKFANVACTSSVTPGKKSYDKLGVACLQKLYADRTKQLANSRTLGGLRIYYVDRYAALNDPNPSTDTINVATKSVSTPRIEGSDPTAAS